MKKYVSIVYMYLSISISGIAQSKGIVLSSRFFHPVNSKDTLNTLSMVEKLKVNQIDWLYCIERRKLKILKKKNVRYSLAINPQIPDSGEYTTRGRIVGINGEKLVASWMKGWGQKNANWGCVNSPFFQNLFIKKTFELIDLGAYGIVVDDARFNEQAIEWGGCFCDFCMKKFTEYLITTGHNQINKSFNYKLYLKNMGINKFLYKNQNITFNKEFYNFQKQSVIAFLNMWRSKIKSYSKGTVLLTNNYKGQWNDIYTIFDGGICEVVKDSLVDNYFRKTINTIRNLHKTQSFTLASNDFEYNLFFLLLCKKYHITAVAPWDVFIGTGSNSKPSRYFMDFNILQPIFLNFERFNGYKILHGNIYDTIQLNIGKKINIKYRK